MWRGEKLKNEKIVLPTIAHCQRLKSLRTIAALMLTTLMLVVAASTAATAQTFKTLHSFDGTDGNAPYAVLVQATNGNLYGTTTTGGAHTRGTVFEITPSGTLRRLHSFDTNGGADGALPYAGLIQATNGNLYGTTTIYGANNGGTVFKITPSGKLTTLYSFCLQPGCADGSSPYAGLVQAINGNLYGTTNAGGAGGANKAGTVFQITPSGTLKTLLSFDGANGAYPYAGLVQATNGYLYGTTSAGGGNGAGEVFKFTPSGEVTAYGFCSKAGCLARPYAGLAQADNGNLYGTTLARGGTNGLGTVFKMTPSGKLTTLHTFDATHGYANPYAGLVQATDGNLYGTTEAGGAYGWGTVFEITPSGKLTTLYNFCPKSGCADGKSPYAGLVQDTNGTFYGTTEAGGANGVGTVFSLSVGLGPFLETQTTSGKVGAAVKILGTSLTGATSVTFNGTAAVFKVVAPSLITTTVPTGATTGTVEVTTPKGTLKSNVAFHVTP
jgi:uncharacterized repeat protein (TIGR03803 family)